MDGWRSRKPERKRKIERQREREGGGKVARMIGEETKGVDNRENNRNWRYTEYNQLNTVHAGLCGLTTLHRLRFSANSHLCYFSFFHVLFLLRRY